MSLVDPKAGRAIVENRGNDLNIIIPTKKRIFITLFMVVWLGGWFMGECFAIRALFNGVPGGVNLFLLFWLCGWTLGGIYIIFAILWTLAGKEIITISRGMLRVERKIFGLGTDREYLISEIKNFRVIEEDMFSRNRHGSMRFWGMGGNINFDYGMKAVKLYIDNII